MTSLPLPYFTSLTFIIREGIAPSCLCYCVEPCHLIYYKFIAAGCKGFHPSTVVRIIKRRDIKLWLLNLSTYSNGKLTIKIHILDQCYVSYESLYLYQQGCRNLNVLLFAYVW
jgi:hypothetical protein